MTNSIRCASFLVFSLLTALSAHSFGQAPNWANDERSMLKASHLTAARIASRLLSDFVRSIAYVPNRIVGDRQIAGVRYLPAPAGKPEIELIGPSLKRLFDAEMALVANPQDRLRAALRYYRLARVFAVAEKHAYDTGQVAGSTFDPKASFFLADATVEVVQARRAGRLTEPVVDVRGAIRGAFTPQFVFCDFALLAASCLAAGPQPEDVDGAALSKEAFDALKPFVPPSRNPELEQLLQLRCEIATNKLQLDCQVFQAGAKGVMLDRLFHSLRHRLAAELDLSSKLSDQVKAYERALTIVKWIEPICEARFKAGQLHDTDRDLARYHRLDYQIQWMRAKARLDAESKKPK